MWTVDVRLEIKKDEVMQEVRERRLFSNADQDGIQKCFEFFWTKIIELHDKLYGEYKP